MFALLGPMHHREGTLLSDYLHAKPSSYATHAMGRMGMGNNHPLPQTTHPLDHTRNKVPIAPTHNLPHVVTDTRSVQVEPWWHRMNGWRMAQHVKQTVQATPVLHPTEWPKHIWGLFGDLFGYIGWSYKDLVEQFKAWDGTWQGLLTHVGFWWRIIVTVFITLGILEIATWAESFVNLVRILWSAATSVFGVAVDLVEEFWRVIARLWDDVTSILQ